MSKAFVPAARVTLVLISIACAFCVLIGRLFYLHVLEREKLLEHVQNNRPTNTQNAHAIEISTSVTRAAGTNALLMVDYLN